MSARENSPRSPRSLFAHHRVALAAAALLLATPMAVWLASRLGWGDFSEWNERVPMVIMAAFIAHSGNRIPKRIASRTCHTGDPARVQALQRLAGWTWVLAGLALGTAWTLLGSDRALAVTFSALPSALAINALICWGMFHARRSAA